MTHKITWRVQPAPTGQYRSFHRRGWPMAYIGDEVAVSLTCEEDYVPALVRAGKHGPISIHLALVGGSSFNWRTIKAKAATLDDAKALAAHAVNKHAAKMWALREK